MSIIPIYEGAAGRQGVAENPIVLELNSPITFDTPGFSVDHDRLSGYAISKCVDMRSCSLKQAIAKAKTGDPYSEVPIEVGDILQVIHVPKHNALRAISIINTAPKAGWGIKVNVRTTAADPASDVVTLVSDILDMGAMDEFEAWYFDPVLAKSPVAVELEITAVPAGYTGGVCGCNSPSPYFSVNALVDHFFTGCRFGRVDGRDCGCAPIPPTTTTPAP